MVTFGSITYVDGVHPSRFAPNATMARIKEVTHDPVPEVVFDLAVFDYTNTSSSYRGNWVYRSTRIPHLYAHPAMPVSDLAVRDDHGIPCLEFCADTNRTYFVESSTDLVHWEEIGEALSDESGEFEFEDKDAEEPTRFYRIVTK